MVRFVFSSVNDPSEIRLGARKAQESRKMQELLKESQFALIVAIRNGDESAFAEHYTGFVDPLVNFLKKFLGDTEEAKEVAQDVFVKLWEYRDRIDPNKPLGGLMFTFAKNMALNALKKRHTHSKYYGEQLSSQTEVGLATDEYVISRETELLIRQVVAHMPPQRRKVFMLSRDEGLSHGEIAERMNISTDTVKSHIRLALKSVREIVTYIVIFHHL